MLPEQLHAAAKWMQASRMHSGAASWNLEQTTSQSGATNYLCQIITNSLEVAVRQPLSICIRSISVRLQRGQKSLWVASMKVCSSLQRIIISRHNHVSIAVYRHPSFSPIPSLLLVLANCPIMSIKHHCKPGAWCTLIVPWPAEQLATHSSQGTLSLKPTSGICQGSGRSRILSNIQLPWKM